MSEQPTPFSIIITNPEQLTVPISASTELSKMFVHATQKFNQLLEQSRREEIESDNGHPHIIITDHPDLKWWFEEMRKIATDIAKLNQQAEIKDQEHKLNAMNLIIQSGVLTREQQEYMTRLALRGELNTESNTNADSSSE